MVRRSNSLSDIVEELKFGEEPRDPADVEREQHEHNTRWRTHCSFVTRSRGIKTNVSCLLNPHIVSSVDCPSLLIGGQNCSANR